MAMIEIRKRVHVHGAPCTLWESRASDGLPIYAVTKDRHGVPVQPKDGWADTRCAALKLRRRKIRLEALYDQCN